MNIVVAPLSLSAEVPEYEGTLFVLDIDGTLADASMRMQGAGPEPKRIDEVEYQAWLERIQSAETLINDPVVPGMCSLAWALENHWDVAVYLTARVERFRAVTQNWLIKHNFPEFKLLMRNEGNVMESAEFKEVVIKYYKDFYRREHVVVIDDNSELVSACKRNGWTFLRAMSGGTLEK